MYASFLGFCAPYIWTFLNSLFKIEFFNKLLKGFFTIFLLDRASRFILSGFSTWG
jgi:hypothetical protein